MPQAPARTSTPPSSPVRCAACGAPPLCVHAGCGACAQMSKRLSQPSLPRGRPGGALHCGAGCAAGRCYLGGILHVEEDVEARPCASPAHARLALSAHGAFCTSGPPSVCVLQAWHQTVSHSFSLVQLGMHRTVERFHAMGACSHRAGTEQNIWGNCRPDAQCHAKWQAHVGSRALAGDQPAHPSSAQQRLAHRHVEAARYSRRRGAHRSPLPAPLIGARACWWTRQARVHAPLPSPSRHVRAASSPLAGPLPAAKHAAGLARTLAKQAAVRTVRISQGAAWSARHACSLG
jgi:hypothetical protein